MSAPNTTGEQRHSIENLKIGDYIACRYQTEEASKVGIFSELGTVSNDTVEFSLSSDNLNGKVYFLKIDTGTLICDRPIFSGSKMVLNKENLVSGSINGTIFPNKDILVRLPCYREMKILDTTLGGMIELSEKLSNFNVELNSKEQIMEWNIGTVTNGSDSTYVLLPAYIKWGTVISDILFDNNQTYEDYDTGYPARFVFIYKENNLTTNLSGR